MATPHPPRVGIRALLACTLTGLAASAFAQGTESASAPGAAVPAAAPVATAAASLVLKTQAINPEDLLDSNRTVVVPTLYLTLLTDGRVAATKQSGFFQRGNSTAKASATYTVAGLDKAFAQQLAKAAYEDFVAQLRQAGYTVLTYDDVKDRDFMQAAARDVSQGPMGLPTKSEGGNNYVVAAPSDAQLFKSGLAGGDLSEFISAGKSKFTDATLLFPHYTFVAPQSWAEGSRGYQSVSAEANVAPGMNMWAARVTWMGQPKSRMMRGIPGVATTEQVINVTENAGVLSKTADTTPQAANALGSVLGMLTGTGSIQTSSSAYQLAIDRVAYSAGVLQGVRAFNAEVAKVAASAKP